MYWDAYLADTTHLTTEEHGAYLLLLAAMWRRNGSVPDDDKDNARILGLTVAKWRKVKARLAEFLIVSGGMITQKKLQETWENTQEKIEKNRRNGAAGGRAAASNNNNLDQANANETLSPKATIPEPEPEPDIRKKDTNVSLALVAHETKPDRFAEFWDQYPHRNGAKKGKAAAQKAWAKSLRSGVSPDQIIGGAMRYAGDRQVLDGYAQNPATWLNQKGWEDDIEQPSGISRHGSGPSGRGNAMVDAFASVAAARLARDRGGSGNGGGFI
jgi:uncharacterized protein YdaU (DUF1376 family)